MNQIITISLYKREPDYVGIVIVLAVGVVCLGIYLWSKHK